MPPTSAYLESAASYRVGAEALGLPLDRIRQEGSDQTSELPRRSFHQEVTASEHATAYVVGPCAPDGKWIAELFRQSSLRPQGEQRARDSTAHRSIGFVGPGVEPGPSVLCAHCPNNLRLAHAPDVLVDDFGFDDVGAAPLLDDVPHVEI